MIFNKLYTYLHNSHILLIHDLCINIDQTINFLIIDNFHYKIMCGCHSLPEYSSETQLNNFHYET